MFFKFFEAQKNHLGSTQILSNENGNIVEQYIYDVYGKPYIKDGNSDNYREYKNETKNTRLYTGREYEPMTGLYYLRARYYSPKLGRFISEDPIGIRDDVNLYTYTGNNPINFVDRNGKAKMFVAAYDNYLNLKNEYELLLIQSRQLDLTPEEALRLGILESKYHIAEEYAKFLHYARNQFNDYIEMPINALDAYAKGWIQLPYIQSQYHQFEVPNGEENAKWVSPDGHYEIVFSYLDGSIDNSIENMGTYNFYSPDFDPDGLWHLLYDVAPWREWGSGPGDLNYLSYQ